MSIRRQETIGKNQFKTDLGLLGGILIFIVVVSKYRKPNLIQSRYFRPAHRPKIAFRDPPTKKAIAIGMAMDEKEIQQCHDVWLPVTNSARRKASLLP